MLRAENNKKGFKGIAPCILFIVVLVFIQASAAEDEFIYDSKGKRSPFSEPVMEGHGVKGDASDQEVVERIREMLTGVLWDRRKPIAFLAGAEKEVVEVGDDIEGWKIIDIRRSGIVIKKDSKVIEVQIHEEEEDAG